MHQWLSSGTFQVFCERTHKWFHQRAFDKSGFLDTNPMARNVHRKADTSFSAKEKNTGVKARVRGIAAAE